MISKDIKALTLTAVLPPCSPLVTHTDLSRMAIKTSSSQVELIRMLETFHTTSQTPSLHSTKLKMTNQVLLADHLTRPDKVQSKLTVVPYSYSSPKNLQSEEELKSTLKLKAITLAPLLTTSTSQINLVFKKSSQTLLSKLDGTHLRLT